MTLAIIEETLQPCLTALQTHPLYRAIETVEDVGVFMESHVFCVWDFMNLLTGLQHHLSCVSIPWRPPMHGVSSRLLHEILVEEASDYIDGEYTSHFMYYLTAYRNLTNNQHALTEFLAVLPDLSYTEAIYHPSVPVHVQPFLKTTQQLVEGPLIAAVAAFTYGRECAVEPMFTALITEADVLNRRGLQGFLAYLNRHIDLDGSRHSIWAKDMLAQLCKTPSDWDMATNAACCALQARLDLWNVLLQQIKGGKRV